MMFTTPTVIRDEGLLANVCAVGALLKTGLDAMKDRFEAVGDVRAGGFFLGVDLVTDKTSKAPNPVLAHRVVNAMRDKGVLISATGPGLNVLKLRPQLVFKREHADLFLGKLNETLVEAIA